MNQTIPIEFTCYILIINISALLLVYLISKNVLNYVFFADKPKSFKRGYRKKHNFFYKALFGYVFNKQYIQTTKYKSYLKVFYGIYILLTVYGTILSFYSLLSFKEANIPTFFKFFEIAYICIVLLYLLWYRLHCNGKGYCWWFPPTWWKGSFFMNLP